MTEIRSPLDEKPNEDAKPVMGVLDERGTETAAKPGKRKTPPFVALWRALEAHFG